VGLVVESAEMWRPDSDTKRLRVTSARKNAAMAAEAKENLQASDRLRIERPASEGVLEPGSFGAG